MCLRSDELARNIILVKKKNIYIMKSEKVEKNIYFMLDVIYIELNNNLKEYISYFLDLYLFFSVIKREHLIFIQK